MNESTERFADNMSRIGGEIALADLQIKLLKEFTLKESLRVEQIFEIINEVRANV